MEIKEVLSGKKLLSPLNIEVIPSLSRDPRAGGRVIISVDRDGSKFKVKWGLFIVSGLDSASLKVIDGPYLPADLAAFQRFINSDGKDNDFYFTDGKAFLRNPDGSFVQIYPSQSQEIGQISSENVGSYQSRSQPNLSLIFSLLLIAFSFLFVFLKGARKRKK